MRILMSAGLLFLIGLVPLTSNAQLEVKVQKQFAKANPSARFFEKNGTASMIYGTAFSTGATPLQSANNHISNWPELYGKQIGGLVPEVKPNGNILQGVMPNPETGVYKFYTFRFNQVYSGLPVFRSGVGFLVRNMENNPLVMTGFDVKQMSGFDVFAEGITEAKATDAMLENVTALMDGTFEIDEEEAQLAQTISVMEKPAENKKSKIGDLAKKAIDEIAAVAFAPKLKVSDEKLVIWAGINNIRQEPQLAISFMATRGSVQTYPNYDKYLIVASVDTGEILLSESQIHNVDVVGNVSGRATDGIGSLECHPETAFGLPYAEVTVIGGNTTFADANGDYVVPNNGTGPVTVRSRLRGQWFEVFDQSAGNSIPTLTQTVTPPGPADFLHNPTNNQELPTANVNAYLESNVVRDFVLNYEPSFPIINSQQFFDVNTNLNSTCNAFYDGSSINFYQSGGGCNNTSFSDVVYHEYGHHLVNVTGNGQGQFGEGAGDCVGILIQDEPILGHGFLGNCNNGIRTGNNNHQYPCSGGVHDCGNLLSGCIWSTRNELVITEPNDYRDISASLFLGMMIVRGNSSQNGSTIDPSITIMYLELDDDDTEIGNGTPHYQEIAAGFGAHSMDAPPLDLLSIEYPSGLPELVSPSGGVALTVQVTDLLEQHASGTAFLHVDRGNGFETFAMNEVSAGLYEANFPSSDCGTVLNYYFTAGTTNNNTQSEPNDAPQTFYTVLSADSLSTIFSDNFNSNLGWSISGNATDGQWNRGVPVGGGDRGDPPTDSDGSGSCYLTDNVAGNSDVDGGSTILTSPIFDATASNGNDVILSYSRWYNNIEGNAPEADIFVVQVSNNGGSSWSSLETVGPSGSEVQGGWINKSFRLEDFITLTSQMRVRFNASDLGDGSIVEAGIDAFKVLAIGCAQTIAPDSVVLNRGVIDSGDVGDVESSDDQRLVLEMVGKLPRIDAEFKGVSPTETPSMLSITIESNTDETQADITQTIELYNYQSDQFENVDSRVIGNSDSTAVVEITGDLSQYVEPGTKCVEARVLFTRSTGLRIKTRFKAGVDQLTWLIGS